MKHVSEGRFKPTIFTPTYLKLSSVKIESTLQGLKDFESPLHPPPITYQRKKKKTQGLWLKASALIPNQMPNPFLVGVSDVCV